MPEFGIEKCTRKIKIDCATNFYALRVICFIKAVFDILYFWSKNLIHLKSTYDFFAFFEN